MRLYIDFETRSACDIKKSGAWVYSEHPTTDVLCMAFKWEGKRPDILFSWPMHKHAGAVKSMLDSADQIEAHNASFEYAIWTNVCQRRYGWPELPLEKLRCSAAKAAMHSLPRSLEGACAALRLQHQKDMIGHRLMLKMCRPRAPRKDEPPANPNDPYGYYWHEDPEDLARLYSYCCKDVIAEEALSNALVDLPEQELRIWKLDQIINARGIQADVESAKNMIEMVAEHEKILLRRLGKLTCGSVKTAKQVEKLLEYLRGLSVELPDLAAATVTKALKGELPHAIPREILEIRQSLARSSASKYQAIIDRVSRDGRVKGTLLYHGAGTGRWAGAGIQPQNFPARIKTDESPEEILGVVNAGGLRLFTAVCQSDPMAAAGATTRSVLCAASGKDLVVADYSAIEGRGLAWLAGEEAELDVYRSGKDPYIASASTILRKSYEEITKEERQNPGKISVLACGYGGGVGAVRKFGGEGMSDGEIKDQIVNPWRAAHPRTVAFWYDLERACRKAIEEKTTTAARGVGFKTRNGFLLCRLPSGRILYYYDPSMENETWVTLRDGRYLKSTDPSVKLEDIISQDTRTVITYMTVHSMTKKWVRTNTYGGKLAENVTQAICRDIMAQAMLRLEAAGYPIVLSVHDELIAEVPEGFGSVEEFERIMCEVPAWATGFPVSASGWRGKRYRK